MKTLKSAGASVNTPGPGVGKVSVKTVVLLP